jgi:2-dehydropantoate 2-reductase
VVAAPEWRARLEACVAEVCAVAEASGPRVDRVRVVDALVRLPPTMQSSMQKDVAVGQPPELDAIAGPVIAGGAQHAIDVAATRALADEVRARLAASTR